MQMKREIGSIRNKGEKRDHGHFTAYPFLPA